MNLLQEMVRHSGNYTYYLAEGQICMCHQNRKDMGLPFFTKTLKQDRLWVRRRKVSEILRILTKK